MDKGEAVKLAVKLVIPMVENKEVDFGVGGKPDTEILIKVLEEVSKGILDIEKKI